MDISLRSRLKKAQNMYLPLLAAVVAGTTGALLGRSTALATEVVITVETTAIGITASGATPLVAATASSTTPLAAGVGLSVVPRHLGLDSLVRGSSQRVLSSERATQVNGLGLELE